MAEPLYPFVPKSNRHLRPGQFWQIPLRSGRFACGRVMAVPAFGPRDRVGVVVGLMDWSGNTPPTADDLRGCQVLEQAKSRFDTIQASGGMVLGLRPLELDDLTAIDPNAMGIGTVHIVWGRDVIAQRADKRFGR